MLDSARMPHLPALCGLLFTAVTVAVHLLLGREASILTAGIVVAMIGAVYAGFAMSDGRPRVILIETVVALAFGAAGLAGVLVSPWFIVAATAAHAGWDFLHHRPGPLAKTPRWYIPYCVVYDIGAAAALAALWFARGFLHT